MSITSCSFLPTTRLFGEMYPSTISKWRLQTDCPASTRPPRRRPRMLSTTVPRMGTATSTPSFRAMSP